MTRDRFGIRLKKWREDEVGLTQAELANLTGKHRTAIARYESGENEPGLGFLRDLKHAFGTLNLDYLVAEAGPPRVDDPGRLQAIQRSAESDREGAAGFEGTVRNIHVVLSNCSIPREVQVVLQLLIPQAYRYEVARKRREAFLDDLDWDGGLSEEEQRKANRPLRDYLPEDDVEVPEEFVESFVERRLDMDTARAAYGTPGEYVAALLNQVGVAYLAEFGSRTAGDRQFKRQPRDGEED